MSDNNKVDNTFMPSAEQSRQQEADKYATIPVLGVSQEALENPEDEQGQPVTVAARQLAQQLKVNLVECVGTGPNGRIEKADVEQAHAKLNDKLIPTVSAQLETSLKEEQGSGANQESIEVEKIEFEATPAHPVSRPVDSTIMVQPQRKDADSPHFRLVVDVKIDALLSYLQDLNETFITENILLSDLIIKASAVALMAVPECNVHYENNAVKAIDGADIALVMSQLGQQVAPIVRAANNKSIVEICRTTQQLTLNAKAKSLKQADLDGGSFTVFDLGMLGIKQFDAVLKPPQCCALGVGCGELRAVVIGGGVGIAMMVTLSLSLDPRAIDEITGAKFLRVLKKAIENPGMLE